MRQTVTLVIGESPDLESEPEYPVSNGICLLLIQVEKPVIVRVRVTSGTSKMGSIVVLIGQCEAA